MLGPERIGGEKCFKRREAKKSEENNAEIYFLRIQSLQWSWQGTDVLNYGGTKAMGI